MPPVSIISYLRYLHDVNRKLLQRGGMENVLYRKPLSQTPYYHQYDQPDAARARHWLGALRHIQSREAQGVTLSSLVGLGMVVGQLETPKGVKRLAAPLAFCHANLFEDEAAPNAVTMEVVWDSVSLNYDLLTLFLGQEPEDEGDENGPSQPGVGGPALAVFTEVERDLENQTTIEVPQNRFTSAFLEKTMKYIRDGVPNFRSVASASTVYDHQRLDEFIKQRPPVFFAHRFFFIAPAAGELTTMTALAKLIRRTEERH